MRDNEKNKAELIAELAELRQKLEEMPQNGGKPSLRADAEAHHILQAMDDFIFILDAENRFTSIYAPSERMVMNLDHMLGKKHADVMPAHVDEKFAKALEKAKRGEIAEYDYKQQFSEETRWHTLKLSPIFEEGVYTGVIAVARDITERVQAEEALRKSDEMFRLITENMDENIGLTTFDLKATYLYVNASTKSALGYEPEELLGKSFFEFVHPADKKVLIPLLAKYVNHKIKKLLFGKDLPVNQTIEFRFKHRDGSWRFLRSNINVVGKQLLGVTRDVTEQILASQELQEQKEYFETIINMSNAVIVGLDRNHRITLFNKGAEKISGYKTQEVLGRDWFDLFFTPEIADEMNKVWENSWGMLSHSYINPIKMKNGDERVISWQTTGIYGDDEEKHVMISVGEDISERIENERILRESEARYRQLFDLMPYGGEILDKKGYIQECSRSTARMLGYAEHELVGQHITSFVDDEVVERFKKEFPKVAKGNAIKLDVKMKRKDGAFLHVLRAAEPMLNEDGDVESILALNVDVTERVQAEKALQKSEKRFKKLSTLTFEGILLHNKGVVLDVNASLLRMFGITREEIIGQNVIEALIPREYHALIQENIVKDNTSPYEFMARRKDGVLIPVEVESRNVKGESEEYRVTAVRDITERRKSEQALKELNAELEKMAAERSETLLMLGNATASREVRMAELKEIISKLRTQLEEAGQVPVADDPLAKYS